MRYITYVLRRRRGASLSEYGLLVGLVAVASIVAVTSTGTSIERLFAQVTNSISGVENTVDTADAGTPAVPQNCPNLGDQCDSLMYYAGNHTDGDKLYITSVNHEITTTGWGGGSSCDAIGADVQDVSSWDGQGNSALLAATDVSPEGCADTDDAPTHEPAIYCEGLSAHGYDDWYLASVQEMMTLNDKAGFDPQDDYDLASSGAEYWTSIESSTNDANAIPVKMDAAEIDDGQESDKKDDHLVRCMRKGA